MSQSVAATHPRRPAWEGGGDETRPVGHGQRGAQGAERAPAPAAAVVLRPDGRVPCAGPAGLEAGTAVVDDGSGGDVGRRGNAPTDRRVDNERGGPHVSGAGREANRTPATPLPLPSTIEVKPVEATLPWQDDRPDPGT